VPEGWPLCVLFHGEKTHEHSTGRRNGLAVAYWRALASHLARDPEIVLLEADLAYDLGIDGFENRTIACGISEQHMVSMAVGLAAAGKHPICHTFSRFYLRAAEQVYDALREPGLAIRFVGGLAGPLPVGPGPSHEIDPATEAALFPCRTYTPRTVDEVGPAVASMLRQPRSTYLRLLAQPDLT